MKLMTKDLKKKFPALYANDGKDPKDVQVIAKFFAPTSSYTFYATEFDGDDTLFGYVTGVSYPELGYASLNELQNLRGPFGVGIERDKWFSDKTLADVMKAAA